MVCIYIFLGYTKRKKDGSGGGEFRYLDYCLFQKFKYLYTDHSFDYFVTLIFFYLLGLTLACKLIFTTTKIYHTHQPSLISPPSHTIASPIVSSPPVPCPPFPFPIRPPGPTIPAHRHLSAPKFRSQPHNTLPTKR